MSTRARVGILLQDGKVRCITVLQLMSRGTLISIGKTIMECRVFLNGEKPEDISLTRFINPPAYIDYLYIFTAKEGWKYAKCHE